MKLSDIIGMLNKELKENGDHQVVVPAHVCLGAYDDSPVDKIETRRGNDGEPYEYFIKGY